MELCSLHHLGLMSDPAKALQNLASESIQLKDKKAESRTVSRKRRTHVLNLIKHFSKFALFDGVSAFAKSKAAAHMTRVCLPTGTLLFSSEDMGSSIFLVLKGKVLCNEAGRRKMAKPFNMVGMEVLCSAAQSCTKTGSVEVSTCRRFTTAVTATDCELLVLSLKDLIQIVRLCKDLGDNVHRIACDFVRRLAAHGSAEARKCYETILLGLHEDGPKREEIIVQKRNAMQIERLESMRRLVAAANDQWTALRLKDACPGSGSRFDLSTESSSHVTFPRCYPNNFFCAVNSPLNFVV
mmetsp:Transcript_25020/g.56462  ORF Transcript_25020/g.56462 Transcript_25020/m.56462 type:complete len:296 (-) Transcript_25020:92-979(-)